MLTPLEVFFVLLLVFIVFAVSVAFIAILSGAIQPSVMTNACSVPQGCSGSSSGTGSTATTMSSVLATSSARARAMQQQQQQDFVLPRPPPLMNAVSQPQQQQQQRPVPLSMKAPSVRPVATTRPVQVTPMFHNATRPIPPPQQQQQQYQPLSVLNNNDSNRYAVLSAMAAVPTATALTPSLSSSVPQQPILVPATTTTTQQQQVQRTALTPWRQCEQHIALLIDGDCKQELKGAATNDVLNLTHCLITYFHMPPENIYLFSSQKHQTIVEHLAAHGVHSPTSINIAETTPENVRNAIRTVVSRCRDFAQRSFVFLHYSGHGAIMPQQQPSSISALQTGLQVGPDVYLTNDELFQLLVLRLPRRTRVFSLIDACNSGSALALPFSYSVDSARWNHTSHQSSKLPECEITSIGSALAIESSNQVRGPVVGYGGALSVAFAESQTAVECTDDPVRLVALLRDKFATLHQTPHLESAYPII